MLFHEQQAQQRKLITAISTADEHTDVVEDAKALLNKMVGIGHNLNAISATGSMRFKAKTSAAYAQFVTLMALMDEMREIASHDLRNAEQAIVILKSGVAA